MHKIQTKEFTTDDFSHEHLQCFDHLFNGCSVLDNVVSGLNKARNTYLVTKDKKSWWQMIQLLPSSYNQKRTVTMTYENLLAMCSKGQRRNHKLDEWSKGFISWARTLPYAQELIFIDESQSEESAK